MNLARLTAFSILRFSRALISEELVSVIARLRSQGTDDAQLEVKRSGQKLSSDIWETVSAFANTGGGTIILGLSESDGFVPAKGFDLQVNLDAFISGVGDGGVDNCKLENPPKYTVERHEFEGSPLLVISIMENGVGESRALSKPTEWLLAAISVSTTKTSSCRLPSSTRFKIS